MRLVHQSRLTMDPIILPASMVRLNRTMLIQHQ
jgi:hypothetical protein